MSDDYADGGVHSLTQGSTELTTILAGAARRSQVGAARGGRACRQAGLVLPLCCWWDDSASVVASLCLCTCPGVPLP